MNHSCQKPLQLRRPTVYCFLHSDFFKFLRLLSRQAVSQLQKEQERIVLS